MPPHKDEITLVVECYHLSSFKFGHLGYQCLEHTTNSVTKSGIEVVQNKFWVMCCNDAFALNDDDNNIRQFTDISPLPWIILLLQVFSWQVYNY